MRHSILIGLLCCFSIAHASKPLKALYCPLDFECIFRLKALSVESLRLNNLLKPEAFKLYKVWTNLANKPPRKVLKKELDYIFDTMHAHAQKTNPKQQNEIYSVETETRLFFYSMHYLFSINANRDFVLNLIQQRS